MDEATRIRVGYLRESQDRTGEGRAVARHKRDCLRRAAEIGWSIDRWFVDNDVSAYGGKKRAQYDEMMELVRTGRVEGILFWAMDRVHKDHVLLEEYISLAEKLGIELQSAMEAPFDLNTASGRRDARSACTAARFESERKSERHKSASREKAEAGEHNGGIRPFGYTDAARSEIVEIEADAIREAVELLCKGATQGEAVRWMNQRSTTPVRIRKRRDADGNEIETEWGGRPWTVVKMQRLLLAPSIAGKRSHHSEVVANAAWPAIISWEQHERVVSIVESTRGRGKGRGPRTRSYLLSGIATCGRCGTPLIAQPYRERRAYRCPQPSRTVNGAKGCGGSRILADDLDKYVIKLAMAFAVDPNRIDFDERSAAERSAEEAHVRAALERLRVKESNLADARVEGMPGEQYRRKQVELVEERSHLEHRLAEFTSALEPVLAQGSTATEARRRFDALELNQQRAVLRSLLHHEKPVVVRSVTDAKRTGQPRIEVKPDWEPALAKSKNADPDVSFAAAVPVEERLLEPAD